MTDNGEANLSNMCRCVKQLKCYIVDSVFDIVFNNFFYANEKKTGLSGRSHLLVTLLLNSHKREIVVRQLGRALVGEMHVFQETTRAMASPAPAAITAHIFLCFSVLQRYIIEAYCMVLQLWLPEKSNYASECIRCPKYDSIFAPAMRMVLGSPDSGLGRMISPLLAM
jgi:hypothetical protein